MMQKTFLEESSLNQMSFSIVELEPGEALSIYEPQLESALLLLEGRSQWSFHKEAVQATRKNWLEELPFSAHLARGEHIKIKAESTTKLALIQTSNDKEFPSKIYHPTDVSVEDRGQGLLDGTCHRQVRLVFDATIAPEAAKLVLGEVLNFPGRWSSYPPHHHDQQEYYYYEFSPKVGFGFSQNGENIKKVNHGDLVQIPGGNDHAQVSAPGYHMYYLWTIKHQTNNKYNGFEFTKPYGDVLQS